MILTRTFSPRASGPRRLITLLATLACAALVGACGADKEERGMADFAEESTPESAEAMAETEKERAKEMAEELSE